MQVVPPSGLDEGPRLRRLSLPSYRKGTDATVLGTIGETEVNCAVWLRSLPLWLEGALVRWARTTDQGPFDRVVRGVDECDEAFDAVDDVALRHWLRADARGLAETFCRLGVTRRFRILFGPLRGDQCRKFHCDFIRLRMITTYAGPGTEWLPEEAVRREVLESVPECPVEANEKIVRDPSLVERARAGDVLLLKGERYPTPRPIIHRSPPIEATGDIRVVLALTTFDPAP